MDEELRQRIARWLRGDRFPALAVSVLYAAFGAWWILVTDRVLAGSADDPAALTLLQTAKGWIFVLGTSVILYILVRFALILRRHALSAQVEQDRFLATLMKNLPGMVYRCRFDREWTMEYMSFGVGPLTGYAAGEFTDERSVTWVGIIHPDDRERVWDDMSAAVEAGRRFRLEYRIRTRGGDTKWVWEQGSPVIGEDGSVRALEGFIIDVTALRARDATEPVDRRGAGLPPVQPLGARRSTGTLAGR